MRASRLVSTLSVTPTPEIRNTGPIASWISCAMLDADWGSATTIAD